MGKERYQSGTSLTLTRKEERIIFLERMVGQGKEFSDELFVALKKLSLPELKELHQEIAERIQAK